MLKRPLVFIIASFILGIIFMNIKRTIFYMVLLFLLFLIFVNRKYFINSNNAIISRKELKKIKFIKIIIVIIIAFFIGCLRGNVDYRSKVEYIKNIQGQEVNISGVVVTKEDNQYVLKNVYINGSRIKSKVKIRSNYEYEILDEMSSNVILELPKASMNFHGFNYRNYLYSKNIVAIGEELYKLEKTNNKLNFIESGSIKIREYMSSVIDNHYPKEEAQTLKALLIGENSNLDEDVERFYQKAGIIHVLVVSGAHIALIIVSLKFLLDKLKVSKRIYSYVLIFLIIIYVYITGAGESILRAGIVSIIVLIANILGRENDTITTVFLSAFILSFMNPMIIYSVGFQLSFAGALGIILLNNEIKKYLKILPKGICELISVSISAQIFVLPITAYHFNSINLIGTISSIVVMPIIEMLTPLGFMSILPGIGEFLIGANYFLLNLLFADAKVFSYINIFEIIVPTPKKFFIVIYYSFLLLFFLTKMNKKITISIFLILFGMGISVNLLKPQDLQIDYLYVGHGDSMFIVTPNKETILIDTGDNYVYKNNVYNMAEKTVVPFVLGKGYKKIDLVILSHLDSDHAGGVETIIEKLDVKQLIIGENSSNTNRFLEIEKVCNENNIPITLVNEGDKFNIGHIKFNILAPFTELNESENNNSIVLMMEYKDKKALFMGDMELEGEEILVEKYNIDADILKVGHHGSTTSSTEELIKEVAPEISIISVGERFASLPSEEVLDRLKNCDIYVTKEDGGICVIINKKGEIELKTTQNSLP